MDNLICLLNNVFISQSNWTTSLHYNALGKNLVNELNRGRAYRPRGAIDLASRGWKLMQWTCPPCKKYWTLLLMRNIPLPSSEPTPLENIYGLSCCQADMLTRRHDWRAAECTARMSDGPLGQFIKLIWPIDFLMPVGSVPEGFWLPACCEALFWKLVNSAFTLIPDCR